MSTFKSTDRQPITHELKCHPGPYQAVKNGSKPFEWRKDDRDYQVGDRLRLREWDPTERAVIVDVHGDKDHRGYEYEPRGYTGDQLHRTVTYIIREGFGIPDGYCIMGLSSLLAEQTKDTRNPACIEQWPECEEGEFNPSCCRFPKSCSCRVGTEQTKQEPVAWDWYHYRNFGGPGEKRHNVIFIEDYQKHSGDLENLLAAYRSGGILEGKTIHLRALYAAPVPPAQPVETNCIDQRSPVCHPPAQERTYTELWISVNHAVPADGMHVDVRDARGRTGTAIACWHPFSVVEGKVIQTAPQWGGWMVEANADLSCPVHEITEWRLPSSPTN